MEVLIDICGIWEVKARVGWLTLHFSLKCHLEKRKKFVSVLTKDIANPRKAKREGKEK